MSVPSPISQSNEQETQLMLRIGVLEEALDRMVTPLCLVLSWVIANICLGISVFIWHALVIGVLVGIVGFGISFAMLRGRLKRPQFY